MIKKVKQWLAGPKPQFTVFTSSTTASMQFCVNLLKCEKIVVVDDIYPASLYRGIRIIFSNPNIDMIHIDYVFVDPTGFVLDSNTIEADDISFKAGRFLINNRDFDVIENEREVIIK